MNSPLPNRPAIVLGLVLSVGPFAASPTLAQSGPPIAPPANPAPLPTLVYGGGDASPPYEFLDARRQPQGVNVDLVRALGRTASRRVEIRLGKWNDIRKELESGRVDLMTMAYTDERAKQVAFLDETWTVRLAVLFPPGRKTYPGSLSELASEKVAVQEGELTHELLQGLPEVSRPLLLVARDHAAAIQMMRTGRATAVAGNALVLHTALAPLGVGEVHEVVVKASSYRLVTARGREAEMAWVGPALQKLRESGEFSQIVERHLSEPARARSFREYATMAGIFLIAMSLVLAGAAAWNRSLRALVTERTREIAEAAAEKERLAQSLAEREQRMRVLIEQMPAVLWSTDRELRIDSVAGLGLRNFGLDAAKLMGATSDQIVADLGLWDSGVRERLKEALSGKASDMEIQIAERDAELHIEALREAHGGIVGTVGIAFDVSERRRAARALRESEERYRAFVEQSTEGIWRWEFNRPWPSSASLHEQLAHLLTHAYVAECNDAMARLYGLKRASELTGLTFGEVRKLRRTVESIDHVRAFLESGFQPTTWETEWIDEDGVTRWSTSVVVGVVKDGALVRAWSTQQDITKRRRAEMELREALSLVRATLESTGDGILVQERGGSIVDVNQRYLDMWRVPPDLPLRGHGAQEALQAHTRSQLVDPAESSARIEQMLADPKSEGYAVLRLKDGRIFERYSRAQHLGETAVGRVWSFRDVTEREKALRDIQEANRMLEIKNAELERFTYTVSHDLKSPLITIRGYLGHLEESAVASDLQRFRADAERITRATNKMEDLLKDLLALSRVGRVRNPDEDVPIAKAAQEAADLVHGALTARGVALEIEPDLPVVRGDRRRLVEVLQNLIENAVKFFGDQKAPRITVGARRDSSGAVIFVRDNGIGIDPRHREKVFELFEKLTPGTEGTGVGLALVKRIVEAHGGKAWVESEGHGLGSTFCFTLPVVA